jgi:gliding motility-associated-like protein
VDGGDYSVKVTSDGCEAFSNIYSLDVRERPSITIDDVPVAECVDNGFDIQLSSNPVGGDGDYTYEWTGPNGFTSLIQNPVLNNVTNEFSGTYTVVVTDGNGCQSELTSVDVEVTVNPEKQQITSSGPVCAGDMVILEVQNYTGTDVTYQWIRDGIVIPNNSNQLILSPANPSDAGNYQVAVLVDGCGAISDFVNIEVYDKPMVTLPEILPFECTDGSENFIFDPNVTGGNQPYIYEWTGPNGFTSASSSPTLIGLTSANSGTYTLTVMDANGCQSNPVSEELFVSDALDQPVLNPVSPICEGGDLTLSIDPVSGANVEYIWTQNGVALNFNTPEIIINDATTSNSGEYQVKVISDGCEATSAPIMITVHPGFEVEILDVPPILCTDGTLDVTINSMVSGGTPDFTYLWQGPQGFFSIEPDIQISGVTSDNAGIYSLTVTDGNGCVSDLKTVTLEVTDKPETPFITGNEPICEGEQIHLEIPPYQGNNIEYVWTREGIDLGNNSNILIISGANQQDAGAYQVTVIADGCEANSPVIDVIVFANPMVTVKAPDVFCTDGFQELILDAEVVGGTPPFSFEWMGPNGFTSVNEDPELQNVTGNDSGSYTVFVTDVNGCRSQGFTIEIDIVDAIEEPIITSNAPVCVGEQIILETQSYTGINIQYEWKKDGVIIPNANNNQLIINPVNIDDEGVYTVRVLVDGCENQSDIYELILHEQPIIELEGIAPVVCTDGREDIQLNATILNGKQPFVYEWTGPNGFQSNLEDPTLINVTGDDSGTYSLIVTDANGCQSTPTSIEIDILDAIEEPIITSNAPVCIGEQVILETQSHNGISVQYEWKKDGVVIPNANNNQLVLNPVNIGDQGTYTVRIMIDGCESESDVYILNLFDRPLVQIDSVDAIVCTDGNEDISLNSTVTNGLAPFTFEWTGPNGFQSNLEDPILVNVDENKAGTYSLIVTDANGCQSIPTSVEVDILDAIEQPIISSTGPACEGEIITLSVQDYAGANVIFEWTTPNGTTNISGLSSNEIIIAPLVKDLHEGQYVLTVTVDGCTSQSIPYEVTVFAQPTVNPTISDTSAICHGGQVTLSANATGTAPLTYLWSGPNGFTANVPNPILNDVSYLNNGEYVVVVESANGCVEVGNLTIDNIQDPLPIPSITSNSPICEGEDLILKTSQNGAKYEWIGPLGASANTLAMPGLTTDAGITTLSVNHPSYLAGEWQLRVTDSLGCVSELSQIIEVEINEAPVAIPTYSGNACEGGTVQLFANYIDDANYYWVSNGDTISTEQNPIVIITDTTNYELIIESEECISEAASIQVTVWPPLTASPEAVFTLNPDCSPSNLLLFANVDNSGSLTYEWSGPNGFTSNIENPIIPNATSANNGIYELTVTDIYGCSKVFETNLVDVISDVPAQPIITGSGTACEGETIILTTQQYQGTSVNYAWTVGNTLLVGQNTNQLILSQINPSDAGFYKVLVQIDGCVVESAPFPVEILDQPYVAPFYDLSEPCEGGDLQLLSNAGNYSGNATFLWTGPNGFMSNAPDPLISNASINNNGAYTVFVTSPNGCEASESIIINDILMMPETPQTSSNSPVCEGGIITLKVQQIYTGNNVTIYWFNGNGMMMGVGNVVNIPASDPNAIPPFTSQVIVDGCESDFSMPMDVEVISSPVATAMNNGPICVGEDVQLFGGSVAGATYEWRIMGSLDIISLEQNPTFYDVDTTTTFELTVSIEECQSSLIAMTKVEVNKAPIISNISGGGVYCSNEPIALTAENIGDIQTDIQYTWSGPNGFSYTNIGAPDSNFPAFIPNANASNTGTYTLILESAEGCISQPMSVFVEVRGIPTTPQLTVNDEVLCQGQNLVLTSTAATGSNVNYNWYYNDGNGGVDILIASTANPSLIIPNAMPSNSGFYSVNVFLDGCESVNSNIVEVFVFGAASQPMTSNSTNITNPACEGDNIVLEADFILGATYEWFGPNNFNSTLFNPVLTNASIMAAGDYFAVVTLNGCSAIISQTTTVYITPAPQAPTIGNNGPICEGETAILEVTNNLNLSPADTVFFEWYNAQTNALIGITDTSFIEISNATPANSNSYYVVMNLNGCEANISNLTTLQVNEIPGGLTANAGADQDLCAATSAELQATPPLVGTGLWSTLGSATISNPTGAATTVGSLSEGQNVFVWTVTVEGCGTFATDTVVVNVDIIPIDEAFAGVDQSYCGVDNITLNATSTQVALGTWTQINDQASQGVIILDPTNPNAQVFGLEEGNEYTFTWTLTQGACADFDSDEVVITIDDAPDNAAFVVDDIIYACGEEQFDLVAEIPAEGEGVWTTEGGALIVNPSNAATVVADLDPGVNTFYWTLSADGCADFSRDSVQIIIEDQLLAVNDTFELFFNESMPDSSIILNDQIGNVNNWELTILDRPNYGISIPNEENGTIDYVPNQNFFGVDSIVYELCNVNCALPQCDTAVVTIIVYGMNGQDDCFTPNMITPNGDEMNDSLIFPCLETMYPENKVMIFNRWGDKVYEKEGYQNDWNGTYKNRPLPAGAYYYTLQLEPGGEPMKGFFTLVR